MSSSYAATPHAPDVPRPWWRFGYVWLVLSGPAVVVVAGFITLWIALSHVDPLVHDAALDQHRTPSTQAQAAQHPTNSLAPAVQGRNHAATPERDLPR